VTFGRPSKSVERTESTGVECTIPPLPARARTAGASCSSDNTRESSNKPKELKHFKKSHARHIREMAERQREQREQVEVRAKTGKTAVHPQLCQYEYEESVSELDVVRSRLCLGKL
jgi:hypothetical protein